MRILVTGGSGFIGSNLVRELAEIAEVINLDSSPPRDPRTEPHWRNVSILDLDLLMRHVAGFRPTHVVHLAARTDLRAGSVEDYPANTYGVRNMIEAVRVLPEPVHTVYASSRLVFAIDHRPAHDYDYRPSTAYGESKVEGERIVRELADSGGTWSIVRPTSIWGPWFEEPYRDFFDMVAAGRYVTFAGRDPRKSFGFVGNAVHELIGILRAPALNTHQQVYWLSDYEPLRLSEWADLVSDSLGRRRPRRAPWALARAAAKAGDLLTRMNAPRVPLTTFRLNNLVTDMVYDTSRTESVVGPLPYSLEEGVAMTVEWYLQQRPGASDG